MPWQEVNNTLINYNWRGKNILIVEDHEDHAYLITEFFNETRADFLIAETGEKAIETCLKNKFRIDVILMDMKLPAISGFEATKSIKQLCPGIPVIASTAYALREEQEKCFEAGCNGYISKPFNFNKLGALINLFLTCTLN